VVLLLLRPRISRRRTPGPTLPSRLLGCVEDCRRRERKAVALRRLLDVRRTKPLPLSASAMDDEPGLTSPWPSEWVLAFLVRPDGGPMVATESGRERGGIKGSRSRSRPLSGEPCTELAAVMPVVSGVRTGEPLRELDATDGLLVADGGMLMP
jgi:hypothetical protein